MIEVIDGTVEEFIKTDAELMINPVNRQGEAASILGQAIKEAYPENHAEYYYSSQMGRVSQGLAHFTSVEGRWICNMPVQFSWIDNPDSAEVAKNLEVVKAWLRMADVKSVAVPALSQDMLELIVTHFSPLEDIDVKVYKLCNV
jgi:septum formation topological specificity factor MinE